MTRAVCMPQSLGELWRILAEQPKARVFAGGTDLLVWVRSRRLDPPVLVCLERIEALKGVVDTGDGVWIGACTTHSDLLENPLTIRLFPVLTQAVRTLGSPHIRHMGTIGGNIVTASPAGDTLAPLYVLGAAVELRSARGIRRMPLEAFISGPGKTALERDEILSGVLVPKPDGNAIQHFEKVGLRNAMACAVASMAALLRVSGSGEIEAARLAWGSVGPAVVRSPAVEAALMGKPFTRKTLEGAIPLIREAVSPIDDVRASAGYRRMVAGNLLLRLLQYAGV